MKMALKTLPLAFGLLAIAPLAWAQSPADHEAHHPAQSEAPSAAPAPAAAPPVQGGMGGASMMKMMGGGMGMDMMRMMRMMMMAGSGIEAMGAIDHVEGHIAFLRAELKITDAQTSAWNAFADALRAHAQKLADLRGSMMAQGSAQQPPTVIDRIDQQERWLTARLDGLKAIKATVVPLYAALSDEQKKTADELLGPHMGMGMMAMPGMSPGGMMGAGQMGGASMGAGSMQPGQMKTEPMPGMGK
jgi:hypothetical protein